MNINKLILPSMILSASATASATGNQQSELPNVVLILADDLGYGSVGCYGADTKLVQTPGVDRLAEEGLRFTDAHTPSTLCSPTRYSLLTGRHCWRTPEDHGVLGVYAPLLVETNRLSMASMFKQLGYATAHVGKWHLGYGTQPKVEYRDPLVPGPLQIGFDYHFAIPANHGDETGVYIENEGIWGLRSRKLSPYPGCHYGNKDYNGYDAPQRTNETAMAFMTDQAIDWVKKQREPFFLYFALPLVHAPVTPSPENEGTSAAGPYGDFIHDMDDAVVRMLDTLDEMGVSENTIVIFTSDNGGSSPEYHPRGGPIVAQAEQAGLHINGPLRWRKISIFDGGSRVPFVVRWPGHVPEGKTSDETINLIDLLASFATLTGTELPDTAAQDSINVLPALLGGTADRTGRVPMITHSMDGNFAVRQGRWKYIEGKPTHPWKGNLAMMREGEHAQLYDMQADIGEQNDLLARYPERAKAMQAEIDRQREQGFSRPGADPYFSEKPQPAQPAKPTAKSVPPREKTFMNLDADLSNNLSRGEFLPACPLKGEEGEARFQTLDKNSDGMLSRDEFVNP